MVVAARVYGVAGDAKHPVSYESQCVRSSGEKNKNRGHNGQEYKTLPIIQYDT
jgi:hypothetical protein